jgi:hypothetical protein
MGLTARGILAVMRFSNRRQRVKVIFQNQEDKSLFLQHGVITEGQAEFIKGSGVDLSVFRYPEIVLIGVVYILVRCMGKYYGAQLSSTCMHCSETVRKYLGITLFPQAGVALGMVVTAQALGEEMGSMVRNIILFSVLVYELVGPQLTRIALTKAGEIKAGADDAKNRARFEKKAKIA